MSEKIGQYTVFPYEGKLKDHIEPKIRARITEAFINCNDGKKLIACNYDPYLRYVYLAKEVFTFSAGLIRKTLAGNRDAIVTKKYQEGSPEKNQWKAVLWDMGIRDRDTDIFIKYLKSGGVSYNNVLDYHLKGCSFLFYPGDHLHVTCGEDRWKITVEREEYVLYHNKYRVMPDGSRLFTVPIKFHLQGKYRTLRQAMYHITGYSYEWHRLMAQEGFVKADRIINQYLRVKIWCVKHLNLNNGNDERE